VLCGGKPFARGGGNLCVIAGGILFEAGGGKVLGIYKAVPVT